MTMVRALSLVILSLLVAIASALSQSTAPGEAPAKAAKPVEVQRQIDEQLQSQAAERLKRLADYLEQEASTAAREIEPVRDAIAKGAPDRELDRSLNEVEQAAKSTIVKNVYDDSVPGNRGRRTNPKIMGGSVVTAVEEKSKSYRDVADQLRQVSAGVINDEPSQALSKLGQAHVPADVQQLLKQPEEVSRARMNSPVRENSSPREGTPVTPLQLFAIGSGRVVGTEARGSIDYPAVVALLHDEKSRSKSALCTAVFRNAHCTKCYPLRSTLFLPV